MNTKKGALPILAFVVILLLAVGGLYILSLSRMAGGDTLREGIMEGSPNNLMAESGDVTGENGDESDMIAGGSTGEAMMEESMMEPSYTGAILAGKESPLLDFVKVDYDKAVTSDKLVVLYFYANWCPNCKAEVSNSLYPAFNSLSGSDIVGFRVNYNDNETDSDEKALAREFGVGYQHTKVFVKEGERVLKSPEEWTTKRYLSEIAQVLK
ncbi:MAG: hypothetical protein COV91_06080 [Candidatus Taylorbacteria bacterium CG11_big_fil_rev_8_21_14_0_20_46_11]|uniref:Thioredoxin domain-containing protein n=1 Tax=Candidatus Taylorbacteria bacterium CG11_big_fil_rev_8_21_14_0_20_46_11 TaxID=1975025 RepID=A0A2H0KA11_9BACT|nr:MAG: hypothetical protein COV91_06080 [Candidatus Taylorbacteria bacterium CG11_big_fil_rev_8_21_14_0_20_46_11]